VRRRKKSTARGARSCSSGRRREHRQHRGHRARAGADTFVAARRFSARATIGRPSSGCAGRWPPFERCCRAAMRPVRAGAAESTSIATARAQPGHRARSPGAPSLDHARNLHQRGYLPEAEMLYREILERSPHNADAMNMFGVLCAQRGDPASALEWIGRPSASIRKTRSIGSISARFFWQIGRAREPAGLSSAQPLSIPVTRRPTTSSVWR